MIPSGKFHCRSNAAQCRLIKDVASYEAEKIKDKERIEKLESDNADEHDIKKQVSLSAPATYVWKGVIMARPQKEVLAETEAMIDDAVLRLEAAKEKLEELVVRERRCDAVCRALCMLDYLFPARPPPKQRDKPSRKHSKLPRRL